MNARTTAWDRALESIRTAYPLEPRLERIAYLATFDLWYGPVTYDLSEDDGDGITPAVWPGFDSACAELRAWADETLPREVWFDADLNFLATSEPEGWRDEETNEWHEPFLDKTYRLEWREILAARFPLKLSEYL